MNRIRKVALAASFFAGVVSFSGFAATNSAPKLLPRQIMRAGRNMFTRTPDAVIVDEGPLVHTAQVLPWGIGGDIVGKDDPQKQATQVLLNLLLALKAGNAMESGIVKINICVKNNEVLPFVRDAMARQPGLFGQAAMSFVTGSLTHPDALVAMDAVAVTDRDIREVARAKAPRVPGLKGTAAAVLPGGARYYISGQAKNGTLPEAVSATLTNLESTLTYLALNKADVVQMKAFMQPITEAGSVQAEIAKFFSPELPPPLVFVEWSNPTNTPIEIEMIVADNRPQAKTGNTVDYLTPPELTVSKVFSRVAHVNYGRTVYFTALYGNEPGTAAKQLDDIYANLGNILPRTGTDFNHLVKATYYITDEDGGNKLNDIRPKFYSPERPPAASRAMVKGVGYSDRTLAVDLIGVAK